MFEPVYTTFHFITWTIGCVIWLIYWIFIIIAVITFIGWINVRFFPNTNVEFDKILKEEEKDIMSRNKSSKVNQYDKQVDRSHTPSVKRRKRRRSSLKELRKKQNAFLNTFELNFEPSTRFQKRKYDQDTSSQSESVPEHSVSEQSISISTRMLFKDDNNNNKIDNNEFPLTPTPRIDNKSESQTDDDIDKQIDLEYDEFVQQQQNDLNNNNENDKYRGSINMMTQTKNRASDACQDSDTSDQHVVSPDINQLKFNSKEMKSFDNLYNYMNKLISNKISVNQSIKAEIKQCIDCGSIKLKSFEKAILTQKIMELC